MGQRVGVPRTSRQRRQTTAIHAPSDRPALPRRSGSRAPASIAGHLRTRRRVTVGTGPRGQPGTDRRPADHLEEHDQLRAVHARRRPAGHAGRGPV